MIFVSIINEVLKLDGNITSLWHFQIIYFCLSFTMSLFEKSVIDLGF